MCLANVLFHNCTTVLRFVWTNTSGSRNGTSEKRGTNDLGLVMTTIIIIFPYFPHHKPKQGSMLVITRVNTRVKDETQSDLAAGRNFHPCSTVTLSSFVFVSLFVDNWKSLNWSWQWVVPKRVVDIRSLAVRKQFAFLTHELEDSPIRTAADNYVLHGARTKTSLCRWQKLWQSLLNSKRVKDTIVKRH